MLSLFSLGVDPLQPEPLRAVAGSRCPSANPPKGLLYNHMSKTGGTTMKLLLTEAMGVKNSQGNVTLHHAESHIAGSDKSLGKDGALIFQDDTARDRLDMRGAAGLAGGRGDAGGQPRAH